MAQQLNPFALISGRVGDKVFCILNGKSYVRSRPAKPAKDPTDKQLSQRAKFALVMGFLTPIMHILNESYRRINTKKPGVQRAITQILNHALKGEYPNFEIDYAKASLISGSLAVPTGIMTYTPGSRELNFSWSGCIQPNSYCDDQLMALIYCPILKEFWYDLNLGIRRDDEFCTIQIPDLFCGREIHVWLAYRSADQHAYSNTRYMGGLRKEKWEMLGAGLEALSLIKE